MGKCQVSQGREQGGPDRPINEVRKESPSDRGRCGGRRRIGQKRRTQFTVVAEPPRGLFLQAPQDRCAQALRDFAPQRRGRFRGAFQHRRHEPHKVVGLERRLAGQEIVKGNADRVNVGAHVKLVPLQLLGRGERGRTHEGAADRQVRFRPPLRGNRKAEVSDLHRAIILDEAVGRLDVAVKDADGLGRLQALDDLEDGVDGLGHRHRPLLLDAILDRSARHQFHGDGGGAFDLLRAVDVHAVGMVDGGRKTPLAKEPRPGLGRVQALAQDLQRDPPAALNLLGLVDRTHAALPQ